ncbi:MAG: hypothetical protein SGCHY_002094 [Lobulomycetales sp.]
MAQKSPLTALNAAVSFYGVPMPVSPDLAALPKVTPVQAHFGALDTLEGLSDPASAEALALAWETSISMDGGAHAHGLHKDEALVVSYPGKGHAFMSDDKTMIAKATELGMAGAGDSELQGKVWGNVFAFLRRHLKEI